MNALAREPGIHRTRPKPRRAARDAARELDLTESLDFGYRLAPRGWAVLATMGMS
jgi:hypothetical protein